MNQVACMLCRAVIKNDNGNTNYVQHLFKQHNVIYKADYIVQETLKKDDRDGRTNVSEDGTKLSGVVIKKIPWFAGCEYVCKFQNCGKMYFYEKFLQDHISKSHCTLEQYISEYSRYETKIASLSCQLCGESVKREFDSVLGHLNNEHGGVTMADYTEKFNILDEYNVSSMKLPSSKEECNKYNYIIYSLKAHNESLDASISKHSSVKVKKEKFEATQDVGMDNDENSNVVDTPNEKKSRSPVLPWYCKSEFRCGSCSEFFYDVKTLITHGSTTHGMTKKEYCERYKDTFPSLSKYTCQICQVEIKHQHSSIASHLRSDHDTSMENYGARFHGNATDNVTQPKEDADGNEDFNTQGKPQDDGNSSIRHIKKEKLENQPWYSGTEFKCAVCSDIYFDVHDLTNHVIGRHKLSKLDYKELYEDTFPDIAFYECQLCEQKLNHQQSSISKHLMKSHSTNIEDYGRKFHGKKNKRKNLDTADDDVMQQGNEDSKNETSPSRPAKRSKDESKEDLPWYCKSIFDCVLCSSKYHDAKSLMDHASMKHGLSKYEYGNQFDDSFPDLAFYTCQICSMEVKHQFSSLAKHMNNEHSLDMNSYETKFHSATPPLKIKDTFSVNIKKEKYSPVAPASATTESENEEGEKEDQEDSSAEDTEEPSTPPKKKGKQNNKIKVKIAPKGLRSKRTAHTESFTNSNSVIDTETFESWSAGKCQYDCKICDFTASASSVMWTHIKDTHNLDVESYKKKYDDPCTVIRKIKCKGCNKTVRHDSGHLKKHAKSEHSMMLKRFYETFFKEGSVRTEVHIKIESQEATDVESATSDEDTTASESFSTWSKGSCKYHCKVCQMKSDTSINIWNHIKTVHELDEDVYRKRHGDPCSLLKMIQCKACFKMILHDPQPLQKHALEDHDMSLKTFYDTFFRPLAL